MRSCDFNVNEFLRDIDTSLEASRNVFRDFDARFHQITDDEWDQIQLKVIIPFGGRHIVFPHASVRLSVRQKSCPLDNSKTVKDISMKLDTLIKHDETMCYLQEL